MYNIESSNTAVKNFNDYLKFYLFKLQSSLDAVVMELEAETELTKVREVMTAREMLKYKDTVTRLDKSVLKQFEIIKFYLDAGAYEAPQVFNAINAIKKSDILNSANRVQSNNIKKAELLDEINKVKNIIDNKETDFDYYVSLLNASDLSEEDKLNLLALKAFESTKFVKKETTPSLESIISSVETKEETVDFSDLVARFDELSKQANELKNEFYYLFEGKNASQLSYHFEAVKACGEEFLECIRNYSYKEGAMIACLYCVAKSIEDIKTINTNGTISDRELYEICLNEMEAIITEANNIKTQIMQSKESQKPSNILYLTDTHGRLLFDMSEFDSDDKKRIEILINKLENGQYDSIKGGIKSSLVNGTITPVLVNKSGNIGCSYIRLDDDMVLLLTCETLKNIFSETIKIEKKYIDYIKRIKEDFKKISREEKMEMIREQDELRFNMTLDESEAVL